VDKFKIDLSDIEEIQAIKLKIDPEISLAGALLHGHSVDWCVDYVKITKRADFQYTAALEKIKRPTGGKGKRKNKDMVEFFCNGTVLSNSNREAEFHVHVGNQDTTHIVVVQTAKENHSGSDARVFVTFFGLKEDGVTIASPEYSLDQPEGGNVRHHMFRKGQRAQFEIKLVDMVDIREMRMRIEPRIGRHMRHPQWVLSSVSVQEKPLDKVEEKSYTEFVFDCKSAVFNSENKKRTFSKHSKRPLSRYSTMMGDDMPTPPHRYPEFAGTHRRNLLKPRLRVSTADAFNDW